MATITVEEMVLQRLRTLPADRQAEVLDFVEFLSQKGAQGLRRRNPIGLFADLGIEISDEDFAAARSELWRGFPRDIAL